MYGVYNLADCFVCGSRDENSLQSMVNALDGFYSISRIFCLRSMAPDPTSLSVSMDLGRSFATRWKEGKIKGLHETPRYHRNCFCAQLPELGGKAGACFCLCGYHSIWNLAWWLSAKD